MANTKVTINFPDGSKKSYDSGITGLEIANSISEGLGRAAIACYHNDRLVDLTTPITTTTTVKIVTFRDKEGVDVFRHSSAHVMAQAIKELYPKSKLTIGPAVEEGFYYDIDVVKPFTPEDLERIEKRMKEIVERNYPFRREELSRDAAIKLMKERGETYKVEMIKELPKGEKISVYHQGSFADFCRGPHVPSTKYIKAFKLMKLAGAYWKGDAKNKMLQRVYGISFPDKKLLRKHLELLEEAEKRDHRKIGKELNLFSFHDEAPGMPFFHDKGTFIWNKLVEFTTQIMKDRDYEINITPIILNNTLWKQSGHWNHYKDNMYATKIDGQDYAVKPMNCPGNILVFKTGMHSYRDLPIRAGEFGLVHRHELSGVLSGLFRVRCFTQDDAHVFCTEDQIKHEIKDLIDFVRVLYGAFGFEYHMELSTRPEKAMGDIKLWNLAEKILKEVLDESKKEYVINEGDGAFYGPKIDFHLKDAIGRTWQCGTIQLDFQMPEKFDLTYEGKDGKKHRPVMLHRAMLGSVERFMGVLIEHFAGKFPLWISPNQVRILPIADRHKKYAKEVAKKYKAAGLNVEIDERSESIPKKVRDAQLQQFNYILVVGDKEEKDKTVAVRTRDNKVEGAVKSDKFLLRLLDEVASKKL
jgi:threonyl-tRNA synthetase